MHASLASSERATCLAGGASFLKAKKLHDCMLNHIFYPGILLAPETTPQIYIIYMLFIIKKGTSKSRMSASNEVKRKETVAFCNSAPAAAASQRFCEPKTSKTLQGQTFFYGSQVNKEKLNSTLFAIILKMGCCFCCMSEDAQIQAVMEKLEIDRVSNATHGHTKFWVGRIMVTNQTL